MMIKLRVIHLSLSLLITLFLSACGGSGDESTKKEVLSPEIEIRGSVSSGLLDSAVVKVWHVTGNSIPSQPIYSLFTNEVGEFSFTHKGDNEGLFFVEISGNSDSSSVLTCYLPRCGTVFENQFDTNNNGVVDFGEKMVMPENMVLKTWFAAPFNKHLNVNLATHIVASKITDIPTSLQLKELNEEIKDIYGLNSAPDTLSYLDIEKLDDTSKVSDHITLLSLLDLTNEVNFSNALERLSEAENEAEQLIFQTATAVKIAKKLLELDSDNEQAKTILETLKDKNKVIAKENNMLSAEELPIALPDL